MSGHWDGRCVFVDVDCDGHITAVDTPFVLRFLAALPVNLPQGCRPVDTVRRRNQSADEDLVG